MTAQDRPYVRVYLSIIDDPKFERVYDSDRNLATWLRLLMSADAMYPAPAPLPRRAHEGAVALLIEVGLIELVQGGHYRVHGLASERNGRYSGGKGRSRYPSDTDSDSESPVIPTRNSIHSDSESVSIPTRNASRDARAPAAPLRSEPSLSAPLRSMDEADALDDYYRLTTRYPSGRTKDWLTELANEFGHNETGRALATEWKQSSDPKTILSRTEAHLRSAAHHAERERAKPKPKPPVSAAETERLEAERRAIIAGLLQIGETP